MLGNILTRQPKKIITYPPASIQPQPFHNDPNHLSKTSNPQQIRIAQIPNLSSVSQPTNEPQVKPQTSQPPKTQQQLYKIMCIMREQIQISNSFYTNKMKELLHDHAKQIASLRELLINNQRELIKKNTMINQLRMEKERETPKKRISVVSSQQEILGMGDKDGLQGLRERVQQLEAKLAKLESNIVEKHDAQVMLNNRIEKIQKGTVKLMASKLASCSSKLDKYLIKKQTQLQKIYAECLTLTKPPSPSPSQSKPDPLSSLTTKLSKMHKQIQQLKQQVQTLKSKEYKYDNYHVDKLREELARIGKLVACGGNSGGRMREFESEKNIVYNRQPQLNLIKSQKLIQQPHQNKQTCSSKQPQNKNTIPYSKINLSSHSKSKNTPSHSPQSNQPIHPNHPIHPMHSLQSKTQQQYYSKPNPTSNQTLAYTSNQNMLLLNHSTPTLMRNYSDGAGLHTSCRVVDRSGRLCAIDRDRDQLMANNSTQMAKTTNLSTQASRSVNPKHTPSTNSPLYNQFYQHQHQHQPHSPNPNPYNSNPSHNFSPQQQNSQCEQYTQSQPQSQPQYQQHEDLQQRLIKTIKQNKLKMPVLVEIDQTGCLKCVETGMYLVDQNNDVFYLEDWHLEDFVNRNILDMI